MNTSPERVEAVFAADEVLALARRLVAIPSCAADHGWEAGVAAALETLLAAEGLSVCRQPVAEGRENLLAVIPGLRDGPPLLVLNGHMDTVPPSASMPRPPFAAEVADGRLWGRGAADMKGGLAAMAMAAIALRRAGPRPPRPVMLAAVAAEESGNLGTDVLARDLVAAGRLASFAVVGEPTGLEIITAHKGVDRYRITVFGRAAHASTPERGLNAITQAARLIVALDAELAAEAGRFSHPVLGRPSFNIGTIQGGVSRNTVPDRCTFQIEKRYLPGDTPAQIRAHLERVVARVLGEGQAEVAHEVGFDHIVHPPLDIAVDHPLVRALAAAVAEVRGHPPACTGWPAFTDGAILQSHGIPAVVCGPGALGAAHADDESVPLDELYAAARIYIRVALRLYEVET
ncbi:MAG: ArgE/DapE family deacylase [Armatimonadota bacterium]|nr:ArgE/DapE family deacylase [Armatimonadota bacterium]